MTDFPRLMGLSGSSRVVPVMAEQFHIYFDREADAIAAHQFLLKVHVAGRPVFPIAERDGSSVFVGL